MIVIYYHVLKSLPIEYKLENKAQKAQWFACAMMTDLQTPEGEKNGKEDLCVPWSNVWAALEKMEVME